MYKVKTTKRIAKKHITTLLNRYNFVIKKFDNNLKSKFQHDIKLLYKTIDKRYIINRENKKIKFDNNFSIIILECRTIIKDYVAYYLTH